MVIRYRLNNSGRISRYASAGRGYYFIPFFLCSNSAPPRNAALASPRLAKNGNETEIWFITLPLPPFAFILMHRIGSRLIGIIKNYRR